MVTFYDLACVNICELFDTLKIFPYETPTNNLVGFAIVRLLIVAANYQDLLKENERLFSTILCQTYNQY